MKTKTYILFVLIALMSVRVAQAQQTNKLSIPDLTALAGKTISLPVCLDNSNEIVAVEFDLQIPDGSTLLADSKVLTNRATDHEAVFRAKGNNTYHCLIYSPTNSAFLGRTGELLTVNMQVSDSYAENSQHNINLADVVLALRNGENVATETKAGILTMQKGPDLAVTDVVANAASYVPGSLATVSWQVKNVGAMSTGGGWTEYLSLKNGSGVSTLLSTTVFDGTLEAGGTVSRQVEISLPSILGIDGEALFEVEIKPQSATRESKGLLRNNVASSESAVTFGKALSMFLPASVEETSTRPVSCMLSRSGNRSVAETFTIVTSQDGRLSAPQTVTIPAGQSSVNFYLQLSDNDILDENDEVTITISGNNYTEIHSKITIVDNEYPDLTVESSKSVVSEGEAFQLTILASRAPKENLTISLSSEVTGRFNLPSTAILPAGESQLVVDVVAKDDDIPSLELSNAFTAYAPAYNKGQAIVILNDDDVPALELTLTPNIVSESDSPIAVAAKLRRTGVTNNKIIVKLSDDSDGGVYCGQKEIVLEKGVEEVNFNIGPKDNVNVDGDRTVNVTAAVYIASCSCSATGESAGVVSTPLTILDDDGPALSLVSAVSTLKEGGSTSLTISRNTDTSQPITVTLSSDHDQYLSYEHSVVIPADKKSVTIDVASSLSGQQGDSFTAVFTAQSDGFSAGTCYMMVTDQDLPDAKVTISANKTEAEVETEVELTIDVVNVGAAELPMGTLVTLYGPSLKKTFRTTLNLSVGQSETIKTNITLPTSIGQVRYYAVVNENDGTTELSKNNNTSPVVELTIVSPYSATVSVEKAIYEAGESVMITGKLTGTNITGQKVDVYVVLNGGRESLLTKSDDTGSFSVTWTPKSSIAGHFLVGACYPGENRTEGLCSFDVYGLRRVFNNSIECDVTLGDAARGTVQLQNLCNLPLTGVQAEILDSPANCDASVSIAPTIDGKSNVELNYELTGTSVTEGNHWDEVKIRVSTDQGVSTDFSLWFYCRAQKPLLQLSTKNIKTTMTKGKTREYPITITNIGRTATSNIQLLLPEWMDASTGKNLPSLAQGESATINLQLTPTESMQMNNVVHGSFGIDYGGDEVADIYYAITPVSESTGTLIVDVKDENTFYTEEAPHLEGATVSITKPNGELAAEGTTNTDGLYVVDIPEGPYYMQVSAPHHRSSERKTIIIDPGIENRHNVTISIDAVQVDYTVQPTTVEERYEVVTSVSYMTDVPVPVVLLTCPSGINGDDMQVGESKLLTFTLTNKGLIRADNVYLHIPQANEYWSMEAISSNGPFSLAPQTMQSVSVVLTKLGGTQNETNRIRRSGKTGEEILEESVYETGSSFTRCMANMAFQYQWICGEDIRSNHAALTVALATCTAGSIAAGLSNLFSNLQFGGIGGGGGNGGSPVSAPNNAQQSTYQPVTDQTPTVASKDMVTFCDPKDAACGLSIVKGSASFVDAPSAAMLTGLIDYSEKMIEVQEQYAQAEAEGISQDEVDRARLQSVMSECAKSLKKVLEDGNKEITNSLENGTSSNNSDNLLKIYEAAKSIAGIVTSCVHTYNKLNPPQPQAKNNNIKTMADYAHCLYNSYLVIKEILGTDDWKDLLEGHGRSLLDYIIEYDWKDASVESFFAGAPDIRRTEKVEKLVERIIKTYDKYLYLKERNNPRRSSYFDANAVEDPEIQTDYIDLGRIVTLLTEISEMEQDAVSQGATSLDEKFREVYQAYQEYYNDPSEHICATMKLEFKQELIFTREAFEGTLTVYNGNESNAITNLRVDFTVTDEDGNPATPDIMNQNLKSCEGFTGETSNNLSGWNLEPKATGTAVMLFIPSINAAPIEPKYYLFGGTVSYTDPFTGLEVTRELVPVRLMVHPSPQLELTYFLQSDIYGDDPLTPDVTEPSVPSEFAVLINNVGYGDAGNVRMVTHQPTITVNEKGLANNFKIVASQLNGGAESPAIGESTTTLFGTIGARSTSFAQWWFTSDLSGRFVEYDVSLKKVSCDYVTENLARLSESPIHTLVRSIKHDVGDDMVTGFLCNDDNDIRNNPDIIYFTNGETSEVKLIEKSQTTSISSTSYELTITPSSAGWNYGTITDPTQGYAKLKSIRRKSDGKEMSLRNFWQTDRTLVDGKDWLYDNNLHFVDEFGSSSETYILTFEPTPQTVLEVASIELVPAVEEVAVEPVDMAKVTFSKAIDPATFTADDITMNVQGVKQNASLIGITTDDNKTFTLDLSAINASCGNGYYTLGIQTNGINDFEGYQGANGKDPTGWVFFRGGLVQLLTSVWPAESGSVQRVMPSSEARVLRAPVAEKVLDQAQYGSTVVLQASAKEGFSFSKWTIDGQEVSSTPEFSTQATGDLDIVANFQRKFYSVSIEKEGNGGSVAYVLTDPDDGQVSSVEMEGSGNYKYGTKFVLRATPDEGYLFDGWTVNGTLAESKQELALTVTNKSSITAKFSPEYILGDANGDKVVNIADVTAIINRINSTDNINFVEKAADVNGDGMISIADVTGVINIIHQ